jgi:hypothetical protein
MAQFQTLSQGVTINGQAVLSVVNGMGTFRESALKILAAHSTPGPRAAAWYSQQPFLDVFQEIFQNARFPRDRRLSSRRCRPLTSLTGGTAP